MKTYFNLLFLIFVSFTLMGCPAGSYYKYVRIDASKGQNTSIKFDQDTELQIRCGNYVEFVGSKERGLLTTVKVISKVDTNHTFYIDKIISTNFGELSRDHAREPNRYIVNDTLNTLYYSLSLKRLSQRKINKGVKNDTISIMLKNGTTLFFTKRENY